MVICQGELPLLTIHVLASSNLVRRKQRFIALGLEGCLNHPRYSASLESVQLKLSIFNCLSRYIATLAEESLSFFIQCLEQPALVPLALATICNATPASIEAFRNHFQKAPAQAQALQTFLSSHGDIKPSQRTLLVSLLELSDSSATNQLSITLNQLQTQPADAETLRLLIAMVGPSSANMLEPVLPQLQGLLHHANDELVLEALNLYVTG